MDDLRYYDNPIIGEIIEKELKEYGTANSVEIQRMKDYAEKQVEKELKKRYEAEVTEKIPAIKEGLRAEVKEEIRSEFETIKGFELAGLSPFISETVAVNGGILTRSDFVPYMKKADPLYDDNRLLYNPVTDAWQLNHKTKRAEFVSAVSVNGALIEGTKAPGIYDNLFAFIKGRTSPLCFKGGDLRDHLIIRQLNLENVSPSKTRYVAEAFRRSLLICKYIFFLTVPEHSGWVTTPTGKRVFVNSEMSISFLEGGTVK